MRPTGPVHGRRRSWLAALLLVASGCGEPAEGLALDLSSGRRGGWGERPNANGEPVSLEQFRGRFVWADYAAPWCAACEPQTRAVQAVASAAAADVVFLTVVTSELGGYGHPASVATAGGWARRFGLDPARVLAADLTALSVPRHILFSPDGRIVFERVGAMPEQELRETLAEARDRWTATGS